MRIFRLTSTLAIVAFTSLSVLAVPSIMLDDGTTSKTIGDGGADDESGLTGIVSSDDTIGNWENDVTGNSRFGSASSPILNTASINLTITSGSLGDFIEVWFSTDGNGPSDATANVQTIINASFLDNVSIEHKTYVDASDTVFGTATLFNHISPYSDTLVHTDSDGPLGGIGSPYSVTQYFKITLLSDGAGEVSFDATTSLPDGGTTALLLGLGLVGFAAISRRFKKAA